jgi:hypothetical protein
VLVAALAFTAACHTAVGRVKDGVYTAHDEVFSLPVPKLSVGLALQEGLDRDPFDNVTGGYVDFHDDFGSLRSVVYEMLNAKAQASLANPVRAKQFAAQELQDRYLRKLKQLHPGVRVVHDEPVTLADGSWGWMAMVEIPRPAPRANAAANDGARGSASSAIGASTAIAASAPTTSCTSGSSSTQSAISTSKSTSTDAVPSTDASASKNAVPQTTPSAASSSDAATSSSSAKPAPVASAHVNVTRGFLFVVRRKLFLTLSAVNDPGGTLSDDAAAPAASDGSFEHVKRALLDLYASMRFG